MWSNEEFDGVSSELFMRLLGDADTAERLEAENARLTVRNAELDQWLKHYEKAAPEAWVFFRKDNEILRKENSKLRAQLVIKTREDAVRFLAKLMDDGLPYSRKYARHIGRCELRDLFDFIYGGPPKNEEEEIKR